MWRVGLVFLCSCGLFPSFDAFGGGAEEGGAAEAERDAAQDGPGSMDASDDAFLDGPSDARHDADAALDAEPALDFCKTPVLDGGLNALCDEFDARTTVKGPWDSVTDATGAASMSVNGGLLGSGAALIAVPTVTQAGPIVTFRRAPGHVVSHAVFRVSLYLTQIPAETFQFAGMTFSYGTVQRVVFLSMMNSKFMASEQEFTSNVESGHHDYNSVDKPIENQWNSFVFDFDLTTKRLVVTMNDTPQIDSTLTLDFTPASLAFATGVTFAYPGSAFEMRMDNARLDYRE